MATLDDQCRPLSMRRRLRLAVYWLLGNCLHVARWRVHDGLVYIGADVLEAHYRNAERQPEAGHHHGKGGE